MSMRPCHDASAESIKDNWTWIQLKTFILKTVHLRLLDKIDIKGIHKKRNISIYTNNTWVDIEYISLPRQNHFKVLSYIVIME